MQQSHDGTERYPYGRWRNMAPAVQRGRQSFVGTRGPLRVGVDRVTMQTQTPGMAKKT